VDQNQTISKCVKLAKSGVNADWIAIYCKHLVALKWTHISTHN